MVPPYHLGEQVMRNILLAGAAVAGLTLAAASAHATDFVLQSYTINANIGNSSGDNGLTVDTQNILNVGSGYDINLGVSNPQTVNLFKIYTPETTVNPDD